MRVFFTLLNKELSSWFRNSSAYWLLLIYLFVSIGSAFYFGAHLTMHDVAAYALFSPQPLILTILVPALTMRAWSSEYRLGTAEFLLTQPLSDTKLAAAKIFSIWLLLSIMSLFLLPFIFFTATWLHIDWINIFVCWIGLELLMLLFVTIGCFISCLCKQMTLSYLYSVLVLSLLSALPLIGLYPAYKNFLFAEVGITDIAYFVFLICGVFYLNILALSYRRNNQKTFACRFAVFGILLLFGLGLSVAILAYMLPAKIDLTTSRFYSLKPQTVEIIKNLKKAVTIDIYVAQDYLKQNPENRLFAEQIDRLMQKYHTASEGMITVHFKNVEAFSDEEVNILRKGLFFEENTLGSRNYFGAILHDEDNSETVVRHFLPQRQAFVEKDTDIAILKLTEPERIRAIGVYLDGSQNLDPFAGFLINLENDYNVINVDDDVYRISDKLDALLLINPKKLPSVFKYAIDQYLMNGGKIIIFFDFFSRSQSMETNSEAIDIADFFADWNIELKTGFSNEAVLAPFFTTAHHNLEIHQAAAFTVTDKSLNVEPFITDDKGLIGAVIKGKIHSQYDDNPFADNNPSLRILPYTALNKTAEFALIGDVDILDETNWLSPRSPDRNPFSTIASAANGEAVRTIVDYMVGNDIYRLLPVNINAANEKNISDLMREKSFKIYQRQIAANQELLQNIRASLYLQSGGDNDKLKQMLQISAAGQELAKAEQESENLSYLVAQDHLKQTRRAVICQSLILPVLCITLLWLILRWQNKRRKKQILEKLYE